MPLAGFFSKCTRCFLEYLPKFFLNPLSPEMLWICGEVPILITMPTKQWQVLPWPWSSLNILPSNHKTLPHPEHGMWCLMDYSLSEILYMMPANVHHTSFLLSLFHLFIIVQQQFDFKVSLTSENQNQN